MYILYKRTEGRWGYSKNTSVVVVACRSIFPHSSLRTDHLSWQNFIFAFSTRQCLNDVRLVALVPLYPSNVTKLPVSSSTIHICTYIC